MLTTILSVLYVLSYIAVLGACLIACRTDVLSFKIPNKICLAALIATVVGLVAAFGYAAEGQLVFHISSHIASGVLVFLVTTVLFMLRLFGAGDAKFLSILAFWIPINLLTVFLFVMSLIGGVIALATLVLRRVKPLSAPPAGSWMDAAQKGEGRVPYGVAIGAGFILTTLVWGMWDLLKFINL